MEPKNTFLIFACISRVLSSQHDAANQASGPLHGMLRISRTRQQETILAACPMWVYFVQNGLQLFEPYR